MNHTFKGILIVVAISSMLVVGATVTMVPIMQNSFAHKRSYFEKATDPNTNTNTNTNSADSSSSSTATADNTNNIVNSACTVAVSTCPKGNAPTPTPTLTLPTSTCHPPVIGGITAIPTDDTCTATILASAGEGAIINFETTCRGIPGSTITENGMTSVTCTFPSTPPT